MNKPMGTYMLCSMDIDRKDQIYFFESLNLCRRFTKSRLLNIRYNIFILVVISIDSIDMIMQLSQEVIKLNHL